MKISAAAAVCAALVATSTAQPTRHYANEAVAVAPVALTNEQVDSIGPATLAGGRAEVVIPAAVAGGRAEKDTRRDVRRKEWQDWAHQEGSNGLPNGTNFVAQILDGVSGIVESALGPLYSVLSS
ncbi:hypothetical protein H4R19_003418 [Coemansia spiralis]|nr:hypothetical protein H4R19_003418 [Coemansia spiralis]